MIKLLKSIIALFALRKFKAAGMDGIRGYGDVNIDSSAPGRHTPGN